jgi:hypothetical protein
LHFPTKKINFYFGALKKTFLVSFPRGIDPKHSYNCVKAASEHGTYSSPDVISDSHYVTVAKFSKGAPDSLFGLPGTAESTTHSLT